MIRSPATLIAANVCHETSASKPRGLGEDTPILKDDATAIPALVELAAEFR
jgi:hypothetical protein